MTTVNALNLFTVSNSHFSVLSASVSLWGFLHEIVLDVSAADGVDFVAEAQPDPAVLASVHTGPHQRQADRAGRNLWRGQSEIQRAFRWILFVSRSALASGILH